MPRRVGRTAQNSAAKNASRSVSRSAAKSAAKLTPNATPKVARASKLAANTNAKTKAKPTLRGASRSAVKQKSRAGAHRAVANAGVENATDAHWRETVESGAIATYNYKYASLHDLIKVTKGKKNVLIVALDHITDAGNMGAILRSAEVVGASGVLIPSKRAAPVNEAVYRTSAGAVDHLTIAREANISGCLEKLKDEGFWIAAATEHAEDTIWQAPLEGRIVIVMGAEDSGVSRLVRDCCDFEFKLPQRGVTQSLNVAQAFTAVAYEWLRRQEQTGL